MRISDYFQTLEIMEKTLSDKNVSLSPPYVSMFFSAFTLFFSARFSLISVLSYTYFGLVPPIHKISCFPPIHILPYFLDYATPPYSGSSFCYFLSYSSLSYV